jgi:hypothetical protein
MKRKTRQEELVHKVKTRLNYLEKRMLSPDNKLSDTEYEEIQAEAIKLRDVLKML